MHGVNPQQTQVPAEQTRHHLLCTDLRVSLEHALPPLHGVLLLKVDLQQLAVCQVPEAVLWLDGLCQLPCTSANHTSRARSIMTMITVPQVE